jgi:hypothetical protein
MGLAIKNLWIWQGIVPGKFLGTIPSHGEGSHRFAVSAYPEKGWAL